MNKQKPSELADIQQQIVAYLDGELEPDEVAQVEKRLAEDTEFRTEMLALQRTWDLLGTLPQLTAPVDFTNSTLEMATVQVEESKPKTRRATGTWKWLVASLIVAVAGGSGFFIANEKAKQPNLTLARDLDLLQQYKLFEEVYSIELLEQLDEEGLFLNAQSDADSNYEEFNGVQTQ